ncbi:uncharacterized protein L203_104111 [Cryptococcus depauperatus CBS 7841]|uniref:Uncharacterized protein n=1 Tax=Cryptococcus depauperatus CBS 7841 TaxID=1295531 RepID=A0A1E3IBF5_9TREE|nr:hypothetical protein L203_04441 [Cryptococcus depauperatus CBS 7841]
MDNLPQQLDGIIQHSYSAHPRRGCPAIGVNTNCYHHLLERTSSDVPETYSTSVEYSPVTPKQDLGIIRRRASLSSPKTRTQLPEFPSASSRPLASTIGRSWLSRTRLALPSELKTSKIDDEREQDDPDERVAALRRKDDGLGGPQSGVQTPEVDVTPNTPLEEFAPIANAMPLSSPSLSTGLSPLPQDPLNILPLSVPSSPFASPSASRVLSPHRSISDLNADYFSNGISSSISGQSPGSMPPTSGPNGSPRTSTSSSRAWQGRSGSRSSAEEDLPPIFTTSTPSYHSRTWSRPTSVGSKVSGSISRLLRLHSSSEYNRLILASTRRWGQLLEWVGLKPGTGGRVDNSKIRRERERETLMGGSVRSLKTKRGGQTVLGSKRPTSIWTFVPTRLWSISLFFIGLAIFAITLTYALMYILNPDKEPLPWRQYCTQSYPTLYSLQNPNPHSSGHYVELAPLTHEHPNWPYKPHSAPPFSYETPQSELDAALSPVGVFIGIFTTDSGLERRQLIRQSYASHWRSRREGTEGVRVRFVMGRPRKRYEKAIQLEIEAFNDIVLLDMEENMNSGKTYTFFSWAAENATVPDWEYPFHSRSPSAFAEDKREELDMPEEKLDAPVWKGERKPNFVAKADDDAFIMLAELEKRLRVAPREKSFWGYLVKNKFMAGECYALSYDLVQYIHSTPAIKRMIKGKEDKLTAKWMKMHPDKEKIIWNSDRCWIYDHPRAGTVYSHGFLYPSMVQQVRQENSTGLPPSTIAQRGGPNSADAYSTVSKFGVTYRPLADDLSAGQQVEALVEGSPLSLLREERLEKLDETQRQTFSKTENIRQKINRLYTSRPSRQSRFLNDPEERGGTVIIHYVKKAEWFVETIVAMLGGPEDQDEWHKGVGMGLSMLEKSRERLPKEIKSNKIKDV